MSRSAQDLLERGFMEHFLGLHGPRIIRESKKTGYSKTTPKTVATPATASVVAPQPAPAAAATPAPAAAPISAPAPAPPKTDEVPAPTPDSTTAEPAAVEQKPAEAELTWTDMEDATLIGLKALNKTWKEIGAAIEGKHTEDLRARYDTLTTPPKEDANPEDKAAESSEAKTSDKVEETPGGNTEKAKEAGVQLNEGDPGKKAEKESKKKNKKGKAMSEEAQEKKAKAVEDKAQAQGSQAEAAKDKGGKGKPGKKSKEIKGILKKGGATPTIQSDEDPSSHDGRPIIYFDNGDGLDINELMVLYRLHQELDRNKWVELSSRFFDKTGKRASPELLKEKLKNC